MKKWSTLGTSSITSEVPTLDQLEQQVYFLTATPASDEATAANPEGGMNAVVVPRTVYNS
ncbi:hypothetical protein IU449_24250 [Nocardia higoensis]|uniref:Uncharacterized protein n=1 Tax=Nocardia higoensis TaxID=228599 RepID=A0ABS0DHL1_9NOCA|nr:hypothetical protein [Nocardia higoensis]MBF6357620.1 hypothetical protein [Nocardia higoensis]